MKNNQETPFDDVEKAGKELAIISKALYHKIINWVKIHPLLTLLFSRINGNCDRCPLDTPLCILKHLAVEAALTVIFGLLTLTFGGVLIAAAIFLGLTVAAFVATVISVVAAQFTNDERD